MSNINNVKNFFTNTTLDFCNTNFCKSIGKHISWLKAGFGKWELSMLALSLAIFSELAILGLKNKKIKAFFSTCKWKNAQVSIDKLQAVITKKIENNYKDACLKCDWLFKLLFSNEKKVDPSELPTDMFNQILTFLDPSDLKAMEEVSHTFGQLNQLESGWKSIANRIGCPLNAERSSKEQVKAFINLLIKKVKDREDLKCQELQNLVKCETVDDINILQKLLKVRDTQIVWETLANQMNQRDSFPEFKSTDSYKNLLEIPEKFHNWCIDHANALAAFNESLYLDSQKLTSLPPEIGNLTQLDALYLNNNQLTSLPPQIGNLTQLWWLYLNDNQLTTLPPEIGKAIKLFHIELKRNKFNPLPTKPKELINLMFFILEEDEGNSI